jgi:hypothetical protein
MILKAIGLLASVLFATEAMSANDTPTVAAEPDCTVKHIMSKVAYLKANANSPASSDFGGDGEKYQRPVPVDTVVSEEIRTKLRNSIRLAPARLKWALCGLDHIFIDRLNDPKAPLGWGFWEGQHQGSGTMRAIGISDRLLDGSMKNFTLAEIETFIIQSLVPSLRELTYRSNDQYNTADVGLLAVIAHEVGHIAFYDGTRLGPGCYQNNGWARFRAAKGSGFAKFGDAYGTRSRDPGVAEINADIEDGNLTGATDKIKTIFDSGRWVSLLATMSPEEDFVETIKLDLLGDVGLKNLSVSIPVPNRSSLVKNVLEPLGREGAARRKARCFSDVSLRR